MFMLCSETFKSAHVDLALLPTYRMPSEPFASSSAQEALGVSATALRRGRSAGRVRRLQRNFGKNEPIFGFGRTNPVAAQVDGAAFLHRGASGEGRIAAQPKVIGATVKGKCRLGEAVLWGLTATRCRAGGFADDDDRS